MATKTTPITPVPVATPGAGGAQIYQLVQSLMNKFDELAISVKASDKIFESGFVNVNAALASVDHRIAGFDVGLKALSAGAKRQPKVSVDAGDVVATVPATTSPAGDKFASNSQVWIGGMYKNDSAGVKAKYFSEAQLTTFNEKLAASAEYQKYDLDITSAKTDIAKDKLRNSKITFEFKIIIAVAKEDAALVKKLQDDWRAAKSEFEQQSRTPVVKDV